MSPLAEQQRNNLPQRERLHALSALVKRSVDFAKQRIEKHGLFGEILVWMVVFSGMRLMWSHEFPPEWWVIMLAIIVYEALKDKFVWPAQRYADSLEVKKPDTPVSQNGAVSGTV